MKYRFYLLSSDDRISAADCSEAGDDKGALDKVFSIFALSDEFPAIEVWQGSRVVGRIPHSF